jgi:hypothetical protein
MKYEISILNINPLASISSVSETDSHYYLALGNSLVFPAPHLASVSYSPDKHYKPVFRVSMQFIRILTNPQDTIWQY